MPEFVEFLNGENYSAVTPMLVFRNLVNKPLIYGRVAKLLKPLPTKEKIADGISAVPANFYGALAQMGKSNLFIRDRLKCAQLSCTTKNFYARIAQF